MPDNKTKPVMFFVLLVFLLSHSQMAAAFVPECHPRFHELPPYNIDSKKFPFLLKFF